MKPPTPASPPAILSPSPSTAAEMREALSLLASQLECLQRSEITTRADSLLESLRRSVHLIDQDYAELRKVAQLRVRRLLIHHALALQTEVRAAVAAPNRTNQSAVILRAHRLLRVAANYASLFPKTVSSR